MLANLLIGLPTMILCLSLQSLLLGVAIRYYLRHEYLIKNDSSWATLAVFNGVMLILVLGNTAQIAIWAVLFLFLGEFQQLNPAFYHSAVNFATLGYGDVVMSERYKLLGALEALNGVLMIGVSTAALMWTFQDTIQKMMKTKQK